MTLRISNVLSITVTLIGTLVIIGWTFFVDILENIKPYYGSMKINTALCFMLSGISLWLIDKKKSQKSTALIFATGFSILVSLIGLLSLLQYYYGIELGIDELLIKDNSTIQDTIPGQMSPITAINFFIIGIALLFIQKPKYFKIYQTLSLIIITIALLGLIGYLYKIEELKGLPFSAKISLQSTITFILLGFGIFNTHHNKGIVAIISSTTVSGKMMRRLVPTYVIAILIAGWITLYFGEDIKLFNLRIGITLLIFSNIIIFLFILIWIAHYLVVEENKYKKIEDQLVKKLVNQNVQLTNFANITTHNLRAPAGQISSLLMLIKESESEEKTKSLIQTIELASQNLTETLDELIETLLIKQDINKERVLLSFENTFINAQEILKEKIEEADAKVTFDFSNAPKIMYPKIYLDSILLNLLSNAIKYGSIKRTTNIHFRTVNINGSIILTAKDNGLGIDLKKYGEKLFGLRETFHQSLDAKGIGLFMTKLQVEAMGGQITVDSEVDKGTEFKIVFNIEQLQDL